MAIVDRVATTDPSYQTGDLSIYPTAKDDHQQLYTVANNAQTTLTQSAGFSATYFIVGDTSGFPSNGLMSVGTELVYYENTTPNLFYNLKRGFAGSRQDAWSIGTKVAATVQAEPHNAIKDALINIEHNLGLILNPDPASLNGILQSQENRFLAPNPTFRAAPRYGSPPLTVTFQNFSYALGSWFFWEFGDGATSTAIAPIHTYNAVGVYTVKMTMITPLGAKGISYKKSYITVAQNDKPSYFYFSPATGSTSTTFQFVDQTDGEIISRYWMFGDGITLAITDPDIHAASHQYAQPGTYTPSLVVQFQNNSQQLVQADEMVMVTQ